MANERLAFFARGIESFKRISRTFFETFLANAVVLAATTLFWGVPGVVIFRDLPWYDSSPVVPAFVIVSVSLAFYAVWALIPQVAAYSLLVSVLPRRPWAVIFAPVAVGILFTFAGFGVGPTLFLAGMTLSFGLSAYVPGRATWWQGHPVRVAAVAALFAVLCTGASLSQTLPGSDRTSLLFTVTQDGHRKPFQLDCQYDQAGRVRSSEPRNSGITPHPNGTHACRVLKSVEDTIAENGGMPFALNRCFAPNIPFARITGVYRNHRVGEITVSRADCPETSVIGDEPFVLVPLLG